MRARLASRPGRVVVATFLAATALACGKGERAETISLAPGAVYPRTLTGEHPYRFRFAVAADRFLHLSVEQRGVDVVVLLRDPAGRLLFEVDGPNGTKDVETVLAVTPVAGEHELVVKPFAAGKRGTFALAVHEVRPAREEDRMRAAAGAAFARAERRRLGGDFERAAAAYREALPLLEACGERRRAAEAEWHLGEALYQTADLRESAAVLARAVARFAELGDGIGEAQACNDLGAAWRVLGEPELALSAYQRALRLYRAANEPRGEATTRNNLGLLFKTTGDLQETIGHYEAALATWRRLEETSSEAVTLQNLGSLYSLIGHDDQALDLLRRALGLLAGEGNERRRIPVLVTLGWAEYLAGRPDTALDRYREALALARRSGDRLAQAGIWDRRGSALRALRRYDEAAESYSRALTMSRAAGSRIGEGHTLANLGWLDLETGSLDRGRQRLRRAVKLLAATGDPTGEIYAHVGLSRAERRLGAFVQARAHAESAIRLVEGLRGGLRGAASRGLFLATRFSAYEELVTLLMELDRREPAAGHARHALEVAERARSRNLLEQLAGNRKVPPTDPLTSRKLSLQAEIQAMDERRQALAVRDSRDPRLQRLDAALRARSLELDRLAAPSQPQPALTPLTAGEIQGLADEETLLVVYLLAEPKSYAWTVDRERISSHVLPGRERIERLARRVVATMPRSSEVAAQGTAAKAAQELSEAILAPLGPRLSNWRRLAVLADGALHLVPFAALPEPGWEPAHPVGPLLVHHEIVMVPSATVLLSQRRLLANRPPAPRSIALLADPVFSPDDERLAGGDGGRAMDGREREGPGLEPLQRLPFTAEEAQGIARLVPREQSLLALGPAASRELVLSGALSRYRIVHLATHGSLHLVLPERSGIVLSRFDSRGKRQEGFLSAPDVAELDLPVDLAVLSACETGLGRELRGEGLVGLTQAFFRAGARRVVVSTWKVRDRTTAELMVRFYRNLLAEGRAPSAALRAAQLSIRSEEKWRSPYFWAGFSLHGDWQQN